MTTTPKDLADARGSQDQELLIYIRKNMRHEDGILFWITPGYGRRIGDEVGSKNKQGYVRAHICGRSIAVHRLVFLLHHGFIPEFVDHRNQVKADNRIENLRECTKAQNNQNRRATKRNASGAKNVYFHKASGRWCAYVKSNKKCFYQLFETFEGAVAKAAEFRAQLHGEFANHSTMAQKGAADEQG